MAELSVWVPVTPIVWPRLGLSLSNHVFGGVVCAMRAQCQKYGSSEFVLCVTLAFKVALHLTLTVDIEVE